MHKSPNAIGLAARRRGLAAFAATLLAACACPSSAPVTGSVTPAARPAARVALVYSNRGQAYVRKGEYDRVIADYTKAIELDPKDAGAYNNRGSVYALLTGDLKRAIADFTEAIRLDPRNAGYYNDRAWAYFKAGNAAQGLPDAARSLELRPDHALTLDTRGHILEVLGRREEAIADFRKALSKDPSIEGSKNGLKRLGALP